jgi:oligopeptide/dipeptide ABC transporter ATP-binding protein
VDDIILQVTGLQTSFQTDSGRVRAVDGVDFSVKRGKTLGIVGESGCGKTVTLLSIMRLLPKPTGQIDGGEILFAKQDIAKITPAQMQKIRGRQISMIFQEPMTALNPVLRIGKQLSECFHLHFPLMTAAEIRSESIGLLDKVGIAAPDQRIDEYPQQLSGGMRQRVMIAMALACKPEILIADEPTTALDVTIQAQILDLIKTLQKEIGMAVVFVTHAMGVVAEICDDVLVMYAGKVVEKGSVFDIFGNPMHPYTKGLLASIPRLSSVRKTHLPVIEGMVPSISEFREGCRFSNRCKFATPSCMASNPQAEEVKSGHWVSCFHWREIAAK